MRSAHKTRKCGVSDDFGNLFGLHRTSLPRNGLLGTALSQRRLFPGAAGKQGEILASTGHMLAH